MRVSVSRKANKAAVFLGVIVLSLLGIATIVSLKKTSVLAILFVTVLFLSLIAIVLTSRIEVDGKYVYIKKGFSKEKRYEIKEFDQIYSVYIGVCVLKSSTLNKRFIFNPKTSYLIKNALGMNVLKCNSTEEVAQFFEDLLPSSSQLKD